MRNERSTIHPSHGPITVMAPAVTGPNAIPRTRAIQAEKKPFAPIRTAAIAKTPVTVNSIWNGAAAKASSISARAATTAAASAQLPARAQAPQGRRGRRAMRAKVHGANPPTGPLRTNARSHKIGAKSGSRIAAEGRAATCVRTNGCWK